MKQSVFVLIVSSLLFASCQQKTPTNRFSGNWICQNAVDSVMKYHSVTQSSIVPFEFVFREGIDSVLYLNTFESAIFPFKKTSDNQLIIKGFIRDSTSTFTLTPEGKLRMEPGGFEFFRADTALYQASMMTGWKTSLQRFFYQKILAGVYQVEQSYLPEELNDSLVVFANDQSVTGTLRTPKCEMFLGGDEAEGNRDMFSFRNSDSTFSQWAWKMEDNRLKIFGIKNVSQPDEKPYYEANKLMLVLKKK